MEDWTLRTGGQVRLHPGWAGVLVSTTECQCLQQWGARFHLGRHPCLRTGGVRPHTAISRKPHEYPTSWLQDHQEKGNYDRSGDKPFLRGRTGGGVAGCDTQGSVPGATYAMREEREAHIDDA